MTLTLLFPVFDATCLVTSEAAGSGCVRARVVSLQLFEAKENVCCLFLTGVSGRKGSSQQAECEHSMLETK